MNQEKNYKGNSKFSEAFWTGLFICVTAILLWFGYGIISGSDGGEGFTIKVKFENVYGLEKGNEIIFSGLVIGQVKTVGTLGGSKSEGLTPIVTLNIQDRYSDMLYEDTQFLIKSPLFVGEYWIEASRPVGSSTKNKNKLRKGQIIDGFSELNASDFASGLQDQTNSILYNVNIFSEVLRELVEDGQIKEDVRESFNSLAKTLDDIRSLLDSFKTAENSEIDLTKIKDFVDGLGLIMEELKLTVGKLDNSITNLNEITEKINNGNGTLAKLVNDDSLYDKYGSIADNVNGLILDVKDNPKKYIKWTDIIKAWRSKE